MTQTVYYVAFTNEALREGFITDDLGDAMWTSTGQPKSNVVPTLGDALRDLLDDEDEETPLRAALVFETVEDLRELIPHDSRPMTTDKFLAQALEKLDDHYDLREALQAWNEGAWDEATEYLNDED